MESRLWDVPKGDYLKMSGSKWKINIPLNCLFVFLILPKRKLSKNTSYCREQLASTISWYRNNGAQKYKVELFINNSLNQSCLWYILHLQSGKSYLTVMEATGKTTARNLKMFLMMVCQYQLMNTFLVIWGKSVLGARVYIWFWMFPGIWIWILLKYYAHPSIGFCDTLHWHRLKMLYWQRFNIR